MFDKKKKKKSRNGMILWFTKILNVITKQNTT